MGLPVAGLPYVFSHRSAPYGIHRAVGEGSSPWLGSGFPGGCAADRRKIKQMSYSKVLLPSILRPVLFLARHSPWIWYFFLFWSFSWDTLSRSWSTVMSSSSRRLGWGDGSGHQQFSPASLMSPVLAGGFFTTSATWEARNSCVTGIPTCYIQTRTGATFRGNWAWEQQHLLLRQGAPREKYHTKRKILFKVQLIISSIPHMLLLPLL